MVSEGRKKKAVEYSLGEEGWLICFCLVSNGIEWF